MTTSSNTGIIPTLFPSVSFSQQPPNPERVARSIREGVWDKEKIDVSNHENVSKACHRCFTGNITTVPSQPRNATEYKQFSEGIKSGLYLWILQDQNFKIVLEHDALVVADFHLPSRVCHTNLTGGAPAYCGGELYFTGQDEIWINGGSGRYPPTDPSHLSEVVSGLSQLGFIVHDMGWDEDNNKALRHG